VSADHVPKEIYRLFLVTQTGMSQQSFLIKLESV